MTFIKRNGNLLKPLPMLFDDFFNRDLFKWRNTNFSDTSTKVPAVNIKEAAENFEVEVDAPGMTKNDFKVELDGNNLIIRSEKSHQKRKGMMNVTLVRNSVINLSKEVSICRKK